MRTTGEAVPPEVVALVEAEVRATLDLDARAAYERIYVLACRHTRYPPELIEAVDGGRRLYWPSMPSSSPLFAGH